MIRFSTSSIAAAVLMAAGLVTQDASAQKPVRGSTNWPCEVTTRDNAGDAIQSDGKGAYQNAVGGVTCVVVPPNSGGLTAGDLSLYFTRKITRALRYTEQLGGEYPGYEAFSSTDSIRVKNIATVAVGEFPAPRAFIAYAPVGRFLASHEGGDDQVTDLVSVVALNACVWQITMDDTGISPNGSARMELWDGNEWSNLRGVLKMPLGLTVRITGVKNGC